MFCNPQCLNQTIEVFKLLTDAAYPSKQDQNYLIAEVRFMCVKTSHVSSTEVCHEISKCHICSICATLSNCVALRYYLKSNNFNCTTPLNSIAPYPFIIVFPYL